MKLGNSQAYYRLQAYYQTSVNKSPQLRYNIIARLHQKYLEKQINVGCYMLISGVDAN